MPYAESDLAYNRRGDLSPQQIMRLQKGWRQLRIVGFAFAAFMLTLGIVFYATGDPAGLIMTWIFAVVVLLALLMFNRTVERVKRPGEVIMIVGSVQREIENDEGTKRYVLWIGGLRLMMDESDYPNFADGGTYRVYYLPRTKHVVSTEVY